MNNFWFAILPLWNLGIKRKFKLNNICTEILIGLNLSKHDGLRNNVIKIHGSVREIIRLKIQTYQTGAQTMKNLPKHSNQLRCILHWMVGRAFSSLTINEIWNIEAWMRHYIRNQGAWTLSFVTSGAPHECRPIAIQHQRWRQMIPYGIVTGLPLLSCTQVWMPACGIQRHVTTFKHEHNPPNFPRNLSVSQPNSGMSFFKTQQQHTRIGTDNQRHDKILRFFLSAQRSRNYLHVLELQKTW